MPYSETEWTDGEDEDGGQWCKTPEPEESK